MEEEEDALELLLAAATEQLIKESEKSQNVTQTNSTQKCPKEKRILKETDIFQDIGLKLSKPSSSSSLSVIHTGDTDSSDDEGNRNYEEKQYNECGQGIKRFLANTISPSHYGGSKQRTSNWLTKPKPLNNNKTTLFGETFKKDIPQDVFIDPIFSMRIVNPKISSAMLKQRMQGRLAVKFSDLSRQIFSGNLNDKDWVICGVIINKTPPKTSQKGNEFTIWTLCDLRDDMKTVGLFMFSRTKELWKTVVGNVIGVLNPRIMDRRDGSKHQAVLSVDTAQKLMIFGQSKDFGICKSMKKNGEKCTAVVNLSNCEYCIYHIKQEYQKCSKRSELQANFAGKGLVNLRNKVLGKNEVFYAGKSYMAIPAKKSKKMEARDNNILQNLNRPSPNSSNVVKSKTASKNKIKGLARHLDINPAQRARDLELLKKLGGPSIETKSNFTNTQSEEVTLEHSKATALSVISKLKAKKIENIPIRTPQYDLKGDLFVNVENKKSFSGKISETITLEDSKNTTLSVISKLTGKNGENRKKLKENGEEMVMPLEEMEDELNYSNDEENLEVEAQKCSKENLKLTSKKNLEDTHFENKTTTSEDLKLKEKLTSKVNNNTDLKKNSFGCPISGDSMQKLPSKDADFKKTSFEGVKEKLTPKVNRDSYLKNSSFGTPKSQNIDDRNVADSQNNALFDTSNFRILSKNSLCNTKSPLDKLTMGIPTLSGFQNTVIDLNKPIVKKHIDRAKMNAIKFIQRNGPIKKLDPNSAKSSGVKKRTIDDLNLSNNDESNLAKKSKLQESEFISDRFKKMMAMTSKHQDLLEQHDNEEKEKYFHKLEIKEKMEEKMATTYKVKCKAVKCLQCKYTSFSASDLCKKEHHALKVCKKFNEIGSNLLSRGFIQLEKRHGAIFKRVKSALPRRESERKNHPLARHNDILQAVETRMSMLNMTYMRYMENRLVCFIPGKVLDETKSILDLVETNKTPPRPHQLLQELRDLSSMAIEHFDEYILPRCRDELEQRSAQMYKNLSNITKQPASTSRLIGHQSLAQVLTTELHKVKKIAKNHKYRITYLTQNTQKLCLKLRKQNTKLHLQAVKLREQERKLQEQNSKILEQDAALIDIKKHMDEWDQKYNDLTAELVRARDEILLKASSSNNSQSATQQCSSFSPQFKSNIKPRMTYILPKTYLSFDLERKRKSSLSSEAPVKRSRSPSVPINAKSPSKIIQNVSLNIPDLEDFKKGDLINVENSPETVPKESTAIITSFIDNLLNTTKTRKRKMVEDIDLK